MCTMPSSRKFTGLFSLIGIGGILLITYGVVLISFEGSIAIGIALPAMMGLLVLSSAGWLLYRDATDNRIFRIGVWCSTLTIFTIALGLVNLYSEWLIGGTLESTIIMMANSATIGAVLGLLVGFYDADRREHNQILQQQQTRIENLNERLTVLNRMLRHDIRNDVNIVKGYTDMAENGKIPHDEAFKMIRNKSTEIADLSKQARQIEEVFQKETNHEQVDLATLIQDQLSILEDSHAEEVYISTTMPNSAIVVGNPLLKSAINNIVENAIEHIDKTPVVIEVKLEEQEDSYLLTIADNGDGLPEQDRQLFESETEGERDHASGLGLWLVNWIIREFEGNIDVDSCNEGTTFRIQLPKPEAIDNCEPSYKNRDGDNPGPVRSSN